MTEVPQEARSEFLINLNVFDGKAFSLRVCPFYVFGVKMCIYILKEKIIVNLIKFEGKCG